MTYELHWVLSSDSIQLFSMMTNSNQELWKVNFEDEHRVLVSTFNKLQSKFFVGKLIYDPVDMSMQYRISTSYINKFFDKSAKFLSHGFFRQACRQVIEISNVLVLHNANPNLIDRNLMDLADKNYADKGTITPYSADLWKSVNEKFEELEKQHKPIYKLDVKDFDLMGMNKEI